MRFMSCMEGRYAVYIMASKPYGTLYIGVTNDIERRDYEHVYDPKGFVKRYQVNKLVYIEYFYDIQEAIAREKLLKKWKRNWKIGLIEKYNPHRADLGPSILGGQPLLSKEMSK